MDVIKQFDLEFEDLHACLNTWMSQSPAANEDLQQKHELLGTLAENLKASSTAYGTALSGINGHHANLNKSASTGQGNYLTAARQFDLDVGKDFAGRKDASKAAADEVGVCSGQNDTVKKAIATAETELDKGFKHHNTVAMQAQQGLTGQDTACREGHSEIGKSLASMKTAVNDRGAASAGLIDSQRRALNQNATENLPKACSGVANWIYNDLKPAKLTIVNGVLTETGNAFSAFVTAVNKSISEGGANVHLALTTANTDCNTARQELANFVTQRCRPTINTMKSDQSAANATFEAGFQRITDCAQKLAEIHGKYEAVRNNTRS